MKKLLLFTIVGFLMTVGAMAQNLLQNSNFEEQGAWGVVTDHETVTFGYADDGPTDRDGNCLRVADSDGNTWADETFIYQKVTLKVGSTYDFSGLIKPLYAAADANFWVQLVMMPVNGWDLGTTPDPDWTTWGVANPTIFKVTHHDENFSTIDGPFKDIDDSNYQGSFTGEFISKCNSGDTTRFTVPAMFPKADGEFLDLGEEGTEVEFFFIIYVGASNANLDLSFDEFCLKEKVTSTDGNLLVNGDFEEQGAWEVVTDHETVAFAYADDSPYGGEGNCLRVADSDGNTWADETFIFQKVTLKVGETYNFSGLIKPLYAEADANFWVQLVMMPVDGWDLATELDPNWGKWGVANPTIFKVTHHDENFSTIDGPFKDIDDSNYQGSFTGEFISKCNSGDTTIFTVPSMFPQKDGNFLDLGPEGSEAEFYFIIYVGASNANLDLCFDEFSLKENDPALLKNGDFEEQGAWEVVTDHETVTFGYADDGPYDREGNCLRIADTDGNTWADETFIYQTVSLEIGETYEFSGLIKPLYAEADANFWVQLIMMPVDGWDLGTELDPNWEKWGVANPTIFKVTHHDENFASIDGPFKDIDDSDYQGSFTGEFVSKCNNGDTTIFTVPSMFPQKDGNFLDLGPEGEKADFYFIIYVGASNAHLDLSFDEFSIKKYETSVSAFSFKQADANLSVYPNPVGNQLNVNNTVGISSVSVINIIGREVYKENNIQTNRAIINTSGLDMGIYIVRVTDVNGAITSKKIIKN